MADIVDRTICTIWTICNKDPEDVFFRVFFEADNNPKGMAAFMFRISINY